jgi:hypothetical protein
MHVKESIPHLVFSFLLILVLSLVGLGQGRGHGGGAGGGGGRGAGGGGGMGQGSSMGSAPSGMGVDRGVGRSSDASSGRADTGRGNASDRSGGRSDDGLDRARQASDNLRRADHELRDHPGVAHVLGVNANDLRQDYQTALATNPNLKFGQFVAATRLAQNLGTRHPGITRDAILAGLADGNSIGETLQDLGLSKDEANAAKKAAEHDIKQGKKQ